MLLGLFLVSMVLGPSGGSTINDYLVDIRNATLISVSSTARSSYQLDLSGLGLRQINKTAFANATNIKILNLANNSIIAPPGSVFSSLNNLEHLSLADNAIKRFMGTFAGLDNLKTLNISNNPIEVLEQGAFQGLSKTVNIFTRGNSLAMISTDVFSRGNTSRKVFTDDWKKESTEEEDEDYNNYDEAPTPEWASEFRVKICMDQGKVTLMERMRNNEALQAGCSLVMHDDVDDDDCCRLSIEDLGIKEFERNWYQVANYRETTMSAITMTGNDVVRVTNEMLNGLPASVSKIILSNNKIEHLDQFTNDPLVNVSQLRNLDLSDNRITILRRNSLRGLPHLEDLNLSRNRIGSLEPECFRDVKKLHTLNLRKNVISNLDAGIFDDLPQLDFLDLGENKLTRITEGLRSLPNNLLILDLDGNEIGSLENGSFVNVPKSMLNLQNNRITSIAKGSFDLSQNLANEPVDTSGVLGRLFRNPIYAYYLWGSNLVLSTLVLLSGNPVRRLENGAFFGLPRNEHNYVYVERNSIELIQGGLFDDGNR